MSDWRPDEHGEEAEWLRDQGNGIQTDVDRLRSERRAVIEQREETWDLAR